MLFDKFRSLVFIVISAVEVGRFSRELCGTGINHLERCTDTIAIPQLFDLFCCLSCKLCDYLIREFYTLDFLHQFLGDISLGITDLLFIVNQIVDLINEPKINLCDIVNCFLCNATAKCLSDNKDTSVIYMMQKL